MRKQLPIQIDLVAGTLAFIGAIFGVIALFTTQHMGALSTLLFIAFCFLGYIDIRSPKYATEKKN